MISAAVFSVYAEDAAAFCVDLALRLVYNISIKSKGETQMKRQYLFTERAHLMCPDMTFGIAAAVGARFDEAKVRETAEKLSWAHPFLRAVIGHEMENNAYFYDVGDTSKVEVIIKDEDISGIDAPDIIAEYERLTARDIDITREGLLKISAWKTGEGTCFLLTFHHLLADGRGALMLAEELAGYYAKGVEPEYAEEQLISSKSDLPGDSQLSSVSRLLVKRANKQWAKEGHMLTYGEYHSFADKFIREHKVSHALQITGGDELAETVKKCRDNSVTVNDFLLAKMFIDEHTDKIIMAADIRDKLKCYNKGAMGNYATSFSVEVKNKGEDVFALAKKVHEKVKKKAEKPSDFYLVLQCYAELEPALLDAAFASACGGFESKAGRFIGDMFFAMSSPKGCCVTNLGKSESSVIESAFFIPPASPAMRKTRGVLTVNGKMTICESIREV